MKKKKIIKYCILWQIVEGYKRKNGKEIFPYLRKIKSKLEN